MAVVRLAVLQQPQAAPAVDVVQLWEGDGVGHAPAQLPAGIGRRDRGRRAWRVRLCMQRRLRPYQRMGQLTQAHQPGQLDQPSLLQELLQEPSGAQCRTVPAPSYLAASLREARSVPAKLAAAARS